MKDSKTWLPRALLAAAAAGLLGAVPVKTADEILHFEAQRSLGNGRLAALLNSPDTETAARAALAVGRTKLPGGAALLKAHLRDDRTSVRALSIYGLGLIALGTDATAVIKSARLDPSSAVRIAAVDAIGRYAEAKRLSPALMTAAAGALEEVLARDRSPAVRGRAALSLGFFAAGPASPGAARALVAATERHLPQVVRRRAMWTIFRYYATDVPLALLRERLHDPDDVVRIEAVRAYGRLKGRSLVADLRPLLADRSWRVQEQAAESIRVLGGGKLTEHLTAIQPFVHVPGPKPDPLDALAALPRPHVLAGPPRVSQVPAHPSLDPQTAAQMLGPAHGPHPRLRLVTSEGNLYVVLYPEWAPLTVANFLNLTDRGFFDNNRWFRIVPDFVVQTGEQDAVKAPGPGYTIDAEENPLEQNSYVISMGLDYDMKTMTPKRDSAGSEYYITLSPQYHLDNAFTVFGRVVAGFDVLARLTEHDRVIRIERIPDAML